MDEITKLDAILAIFTTPSGEEENMALSTNVKQETPGEDREIPAPAQGEDQVKAAEKPLLAFKGAVVLFGESYWVDVRVERRVG